MKVIDLLCAPWAIMPNHLEQMTQIHDDLTQAFEAGFAAGCAQELERIRSIHDMSYPGHEALIEQLMFDGKTSQGEAAMAVLAAEREVRTERQKVADAESAEARIRINWEANAGLRADFDNNFDRYQAYAKNKTLAIVEGDRA